MLLLCMFESLNAYHMTLNQSLFRILASFMHYLILTFIKPGLCGTLKHLTYVKECFK